MPQHPGLKPLTAVHYTTQSLRVLFTALLRNACIAAGQHTALATQPQPSPAVSSRPGTSSSVSKSIIRSALKQRRQQQQGAEHSPESESGAASSSSHAAMVDTAGSSSQRRSSGVEGGVWSCSVEAMAFTSQAVGLQLPPAPGDAALAAASAQHEALLARWDGAARKQLETCAEQVVSRIRHATRIIGTNLVCTIGPPAPD